MSTLQMTKLTLAEEVEMHAQLRSGAGRGGGEGPGSLRAEVHLRARGVRGCAPGGGMEEMRRRDAGARGWCRRSAAEPGPRGRVTAVAADLSAPEETGNEMQSSQNEEEGDS